MALRGCVDANSSVCIAHTTCTTQQHKLQHTAAHAVTPVSSTFCIWALQACHTPQHRYRHTRITPGSDAAFQVRQCMRKRGGVVCTQGDEWAETDPVHGRPQPKTHRNIVVVAVPRLTLLANNRLVVPPRVVYQIVDGQALALLVPQLLMPACSVLPNRAWSVQVDAAHVSSHKRGFGAMQARSAPNGTGHVGGLDHETCRISTIFLICATSVMAAGAGMQHNSLEAGVVSASRVVRCRLA